MNDASSLSPRALGRRSEAPAAAPEAPQGAPSTLLLLTRQIEDEHHAALRDEPARIVERLAGAQPTLSRPLQQLFGLLHHHLWKEANMLYPAIRLFAAGEDAGGGLVGLVRQARFEHGRMLGLIDDLRPQMGLTGEVAPALWATLERIEAQIALEEDQLFPSLLALLGVDEEDL
jgi:iron-sulfur cluster repair protein YtfE (RIC family)